MFCLEQTFRLKKILSSTWHAGKTLWLCLVVLLFTFSFDAYGAGLIRIGTGGLTGVYYPIGKIIAEGLTTRSPIKRIEKLGEDGVPGYIGVAQQSAGSVGNVLGVVSGELEAGLVQADIAALAFAAEGVFKDNAQARSIRAIASLYPEKLQIVMRKDAEISNVHDLRNKRISVDEIGSGTLAAMRIVLEAYGMSEYDLQPVYLKPVFTHQKIVSGELQGFVIMAGAPATAVSQLSDVGISLVPILPEIAARIEEHVPGRRMGHLPVAQQQRWSDLQQPAAHPVAAEPERALRTRRRHPALAGGGSAQR